MNKALLIIIDGCRCDALQQAQTPNIDRMIETGSHSFAAETVQPSMTLPAHFSIFTSNIPANHNVLTNGASAAPSPTAWSLIDLAKYNGKKTAAFYSWELLRSLSQPGSLDVSLCINRIEAEDSDIGIAEAAAQHLETHAPDFCFVYLERTDYVGHELGFMSEPYLKAIETADKAVGILIDRIEQNGLSDQYHLILHSDHGGSGFHHKEDLSEVLQVPWIAAAPKFVGCSSGPKRPGNHEPK